MAIKLYKNVDIGNVPETPSTPSIASIATLQAFDSLIGHAKKLGHAVSYQQEQDGRLVQNILPVHKTENQQISTSSKVELALHTETAFHPYKPDYVLLLCLRGDPSAVTTYAEVDEILSHLDQETIDYLEKPWYITSIDDSFRSNGEPDCEFQLPILEKKNGQYNMVYDEALMVGINLFAASALNKLSEAIKKSIKEIVLQSGDLLVIDNNKAIHGRKPFKPRYDGTDRWVQRMLVRKELPPQDHFNDYIITTSFNKNVS